MKAVYTECVWGGEDGERKKRERAKPEVVTSQNKQGMYITIMYISINIDKQNNSSSRPS